ncbi:hypothetical protein HN51_027634 [Arachis hypogaea]|uniref:Knottin scorpion toxin-like domain-containing protein n=1 Tax=Arachis hypogaea TaxID=3818 RepID=A0A445BM59_ARAHY|nr:uncharacterized protein DS421_9g263550 [Arachis hypogaea]RYR39754.1 hypothetical protein Ahy_A09g045348 [Arachis hypogaea]
MSQRSLLKFIFAVTLVAVLFSICNGLNTDSQHCLGPCNQFFRNCDGYCKKLGYTIGKCVLQPNGESGFCCCAKPTT